MKRDAQGRLLFINAAFLQLYGGTVEAWTGNVLQGWPAPQSLAPGAYPVPYRFETRMPSQDPSQSEQVYDWIEQSAPDGSAFALARNVSPFLSVDAPQPQSAYAEPAQAPHHEQAAPQEQPADQEPAQTAPAFESTGYEDTQRPAESEAAPLNTQQPAHQDFQEAAEMASTEEDWTNSGFESTESSSASPMSAEVDYSAPQSAPSEPTQSESGQPEPEPVHAERDFERRALPLEADSSVLGNNWRDAVIAKALGVEDTPPAETKAQTYADEESHENVLSHGAEKRILLAEDNAINALLTRTLLEAEGHTVETVEDGVLAVEAMKNNNYDLIFMDMRMPNMDGLEATRKIRALPHVTKALPIIALTANAFDDDRNACFDSGMNDFMTKPVSAEELTQMVKTWTGKEATKTAA